jgi:hypothetical protein
LSLFNFPSPYGAVAQKSPATKPDGLKHSREPTLDTSAPAAKVTKMSGSDSPNGQGVEKADESTKEELETEPENAKPEPVSKAVGEAGEKAEKQVEQALALLHLDDKEKSVVGDWQDAAEATDSVSVYTFPMRPFTSIDIKPMDTTSKIPKADAFDVAKMKKQFDQVDRNLAASTTNYIVYALAQEGFRIINRDTANYLKLFDGSRDRVYSILAGIGRKTGDEAEVMLAVGVNGTVFWASPTGAGAEFAFPPVDSKEELSAGGPLKTRVKPSWRNTAYFAYARGKYIHIVWPAVAGSSTYTGGNRICDSARYLSHNDLKICTGKAAKDFAFSADDTVIASLDKAGKLKFWDIRSLTKSEFNSPDREVAADVTTPILTLNAVAAGSEKIVPSTIMFIDKEKPMTKGLALRYMVIGLKQNHSIQLWDLALQKAVQQINLPHNEKADAICSVAFHPRTGVLVVGHPTRNSVYLLHISPPKYTLTVPINQAKFMSMIAAGDKSLTNIQSTAICNSFREYNLDTRGTLRSLDLMVEPAMNDDLKSSLAQDQLMTITLTHSKGIFEFVVKREHLGWGKDGRTQNPIDAEKKGAAEIKKLELIFGDAGVGASATDTTSNKSDKKKKKKAVDPAAPIVRDFAVASPKKGSEPKASSSAPSAPVAVAKRAIPDAPARAPTETSSQKPASPRRADRSDSVDALAGISGLMETMFKRFADEQRASDASGASKQEALLKRVSTAVSENLEDAVEKALAKALDVAIEPIQAAVESAAKDAAARPDLEVALRESLLDSRVVRAFSDRISTQVGPIVSAQLQQTIASLQSTLNASAKQMALDSESRLATHIASLESRRLHDAAVLERLTTLVERQSAQIESLSVLARSNPEQRPEQRNGQRESGNGTLQYPVVASTVHVSGLPYAEPAVSNANPAVEEKLRIMQAHIRAAKFVDAFIQVSCSSIHFRLTGQFLSIEDQTAAFQALLPLGTQVLGRVGVLLNLSFAAAVTSELVSNVDLRLEWLDAALGHVDPTVSSFYITRSV